MTRSGGSVKGGWLFKEEPSHYSFSDLERDGCTLWDGVTNNLALLNLRKVQPGDAVLFYHTGKEKAIVGEMTVICGPEPASGHPKGLAVTVQPVKRWQRAVSLEEIKSDPAFTGWDLLRLPRLSVMAVSAEQWRRLEELAKATPE